MFKRGIIVSLILFCSFVLASQAMATLKFCADPDNLPFTSNGELKGVYIEIAEKLAQNMKVDTQYHWYSMYYVRKAVRNTILKGRCDIVLGLPFGGGFMGRRLSFTQPFLEVGYSLVLPQGMEFTSIKDFDGKKVGVQWASTPASIVARIPSVEVTTYDTPEEAMDDLVQQKIDIAFIWGPSAGYYNKYELNNTFKVIPLAGKSLNYKVAMAVRTVDQKLRLQLGREMRKIKKEIQEYAIKYGFPTGEPLQLDTYGFFK